MEREAKAAFIQNLPEAIKGPVAAANPKNIKEAVQTVIHMCSVLDVDECGNANNSKLKVRYTGVASGGNNNNNNGQEEFNVDFVNNSGVVDKSNKECYYCHKLGHFIIDCRKRQRNEAEKAARFGDDNNGGQSNNDFRNDNEVWIALHIIFCARSDTYISFHRWG